jgi:hypothetical protein
VCPRIAVATFRRSLQEVAADPLPFSQVSVHGLLNRECMLAASCPGQEVDLPTQLVELVVGPQVALVVAAPVDRRTVPGELEWQQAADTRRDALIGGAHAGGVGLGFGFAAPRRRWRRAFGSFEFRDDQRVHEAVDDREAP